MILNLFRVLIINFLYRVEILEKYVIILIYVISKRIQICLNFFKSVFKCIIYEILLIIFRLLCVLENFQLLIEIMDLKIIILLILDADLSNLREVFLNLLSFMF